MTPIATATNTAGAPITVGGAPRAIAITPNGKTAYVLNLGSPEPSGLRTFSKVHPEGLGVNGGKKKNFTPEFRDEAAREVVDNSRSIASVARGIGVSETTLGNWVRAYRERHAGEEPPLELSERARLREAEREVRELRQKVTFLEKVAAYFASEQQ